MWCGRDLLTNQELLAVWYQDGRWLEYGKRKAGDVVNQLRTDDPKFQALWHERIVTIEHILPKSEGGSDHPDNLGAACIPCNSSRGHYGADLTPIPEFSGNPNGVHKAEAPMTRKERLEAARQMREAARARQARRYNEADPG